ncbi:TPA: hypothetical protein ACGXMA_002231 [Bacillus cereus]|uniref:Uncharacterized protein n=3 Tax=Bacillus cereus TaxID=1396 RepID=A0AAN0T0E8_BACCE|nr:MULTISPECIES: hypothetical protein [Bacillus cereus group]ABK84341.1 hypothetical protein BALH_0976 [Bacillus thuringiensis str. Al Hakam]ACO29567.1 conserved hypothetical protein [Bacillus cereus 03BB102]AEW54232.1 Hypothetical protein bcf_05545 [Bacillus cereus F837/76]AJG56251.1 hypothetical protein AS54_1189 [Bacillus cereus 03BB102]AJG57400.1 hypothetical protein AW22_3566 [Bacillus cereus D17]
MDTYIEIHKPATENNEYFLVLDEHDNFENDNILNLLSTINRYIVDVDTGMERFMETMMSKFHLYFLVNCDGVQEELTKVQNYIWEKALKEFNWKRSTVKSTILINHYDPATDIFEVISPVCMEGSLMFLFSEKEVNENELERIIKHMKFDRARVYFNKETIELAGEMGYIVGHFEDEYYIVSLCSEKQVFVCYAEERIME